MRAGQGSPESTALTIVAIGVSPETGDLARSLLIRPGYVSLANREQALLRSFCGLPGLGELCFWSICHLASSNEG